MNLPKEIRFFDQIRFLDKMFFTKHLSIMLKSGISIGEAVGVIAEQSQNPAFKKVLKKILAEIDNGQSLHKALHLFPRVFDPFYINMVRVGEESGNLERNLDYLAQQLKKNYEFSKKIQGAMMYPVIVLSVAFIGGGGISLFVLPKLVDLFSSLNVNLPLSTKILLFIASTMKNYGLFVILGVIILVVLFRMIIQIPKYKMYWQQLLLGMPTLGAFFQDVQLSFLCHNFGIMLKSGIPITTALDAQYEATNNLVFKTYIEILRKSMAKGTTIAETLQKKSFRYVPLLVIKMVGVGEKTGKLDESLLYLGDFFEDEVDNYSKNLSTVIEPVILIFIGLIVAFLAFAIITPVYQISSGLQQH